MTSFGRTTLHCVQLACDPARLNRFRCQALNRSATFRAAVLVCHSHRWFPVDCHAFLGVRGQTGDGREGLSAGKAG
jgi:hypothetical protein